MSIPMTRYVRIISSVPGASAVAQQKLIGRRFTTNPRVPIGQNFLMPAITKILEGFGVVTDWLSKNNTVVKGFLIGIAAIVTGMYLPAMIGAAAATLAAISPFLLVGAAIAGVAALFALAYDDVMNFIDGNDSLIGQILEKFPFVGKIINGLGDVFVQLKDTVIGVFDAIVSAIKSAFSFIMGGYEKMSGVLGKVSSFLGIGGGEIDVNVKKAQTQIAAANTSPMNAVTSGAITNAVNSKQETNVQVGQITVQTQATDAKGISQSIGGELAGQLKNLQTESASGVSR